VLARFGIPDTALASCHRSFTCLFTAHETLHARKIKTTDGQKSIDHMNIHLVSLKTDNASGQMGHLQAFKHNCLFTASFDQIFD